MTNERRPMPISPEKMQRWENFHKEMKRIYGGFQPSEMSKRIKGLMGEVDEARKKVKKTASGVGEDVKKQAGRDVEDIKGFVGGLAKKVSGLKGMFK